VFILCASELKLQQAQQTFSSYTWARPILLEQSYQTLLWQENIAWNQIIARYGDILDSHDYVGTLSSSCTRKISLRKLDRFLRKVDTSVDFYHFLSKPCETAVEWGVKCHPKYEEAWNALCEKHKAYKYTPAVFCNYWICRPALFKDFAQWMTGIMKDCESLPIMYENARYPGAISPEQLQRLWGRPYYPLVPFVLEQYSFHFFKHYKYRLLDFGKFQDWGKVLIVLLVFLMYYLKKYAFQLTCNNSSGLFQAGITG